MPVCHYKSWRSQRFPDFSVTALLRRWPHPSASFNEGEYHACSVTIFWLFFLWLCKFKAWTHSFIVNHFLLLLVLIFFCGFVIHVQAKERRMEIWPLQSLINACVQQLCLICSLCGMLNLSSWLSFLCLVSDIYEIMVKQTRALHPFRVSWFNPW